MRQAAASAKPDGGRGPAQGVGTAAGLLGTLSPSTTILLGLACSLGCSVLAIVVEVIMTTLFRFTIPRYPMPEPHFVYAFLLGPCIWVLIMQGVLQSSLQRFGAGRATAGVIVSCVVFAAFMRLVGPHAKYFDPLQHTNYFCTVIIVYLLLVTSLALVRQRSKSLGAAMLSFVTYSVMAAVWRAIA